MRHQIRPKGFLLVAVMLLLLFIVTYEHGSSSSCVYAASNNDGTKSSKKKKAEQASKTDSSSDAPNNNGNGNGGGGGAANANGASQSDTTTTPTSSMGVCKSAGSFRFNGEPPRRADLTFCHQFKRSTCCNASHTGQLTRRAVWWYEAESTFSDTCRRFASSLLCYSCDPSVGTHQRKGVCINACNAWYEACKNDHFTMVESDGSVRPCIDDDQLCFPLSTLVNSGSAMCNLFDLPVARRLPPLFAGLVDGAGSERRSSSSSSSEMLVGEGEDWAQEQCYDYNPSLAASAAPDSPFAKQKWQRASTTTNSGMQTWEIIALSLMITIILAVIIFVTRALLCNKADGKKPNVEQVRNIRAARLARSTTSTSDATNDT